MVSDDLNTQSSRDKVDILFSNYYERKLISSGDNFPDFNPAKDNVDLFLVALHEKIDIKLFQKKAGWSDDFLEEKVQYLKSINWIDEDINHRPTIFIVSHDQGMNLFEYGKPLANKIAEAVILEIPTVKEKCSSHKLLSKYNFEELAFFILSDVLLDNWQINNIESEFLKKNNRPERNGKNYYYSIMENNNYPTENFGIYGNQYHSLDDTLTLIIYGNNRNIANEEIKNNKSFLDSLIDNSPLMTDSELALFDELAIEFKPKLVKILTDNSEYINSIYKKMGYAEKISFEEFFIWWYHFIYTDVTNILKEKNKLVLPLDGNFYCLIRK